ncbi:MAG: SDR family oxidoreductase [Betaproteobacteria bacterium]|nr:SDR family oxidoreductase [Betaproteobacteria bacterium]
MGRQRILITGGSGLLALNWACCMRSEHEIHLAQHVRRINLRGVQVTSLALDSVETMSRQLARIRPDLVVHTAGMTSVDECERHPDMAHHANAILARNVAEVCARLGIRLIHISTDHLFDGKNGPYTEDAVPKPLNAYARTKLLAEQRVMKAHAGALVIRTNFFGWGHALRRSFSDWILYSLRDDQALTMFDDVFFTPILADRLADAAHRLADLGAKGVYNVAGEDRVSKYEFALRLARAFSLPEVLVQHGRIAASRLLAERPRDMSLDSTEARKLLGANMGGTAEFFDALRRQDEGGRREELLAAVSE